MTNCSVDTSGIFSASAVGANKTARQLNRKKPRICTKNNLKTQLPFSKYWFLEKSLVSGTYDARNYNFFHCAANKQTGF